MICPATPTTCIKNIQGDQLKMAVFFWYLEKGDLPSVHMYVQWRTLDESLYTRYQKNTAMFNWSPCTKKILDEAPPMVCYRVTS